MKNATSTEIAKATRWVVETAMRDHRRLVGLKWTRDDLGGMPQRHFNACEKLDRLLKIRKINRGR